jgi:hypothetical protein
MSVYCSSPVATGSGWFCLCGEGLVLPVSRVVPDHSSPGGGRYCRFSGCTIAPRVVAQRAACFVLRCVEVRALCDPDYWEGENGAVLASQVRDLIDGSENARVWPAHANAATTLAYAGGSDDAAGPGR